MSVSYHEIESLIKSSGIESDSLLVNNNYAIMFINSLLCEYRPCCFNIGAVVAFALQMRHSLQLL